MHSSWKSALRLAPYVRHYKFLLLLTLVVGLAGFAVGFFLPWLIGTTLDRVIRPVAGDGTPLTTESRVHWLFIVLFVGATIVPLSSLCTYWRGHLSAKLGNRVIADLRQELFDHLNRLSLHFYSKESTGSIVACLMGDIQQASQIINGGGVLMLIDVAQMGAAATLLLTFSWKIALACFCTLPLYALTFRRFNPLVKEASERVQRQIGRMSGRAHERLAGIALVKASGTEDRERENFRAENEEYYGRVIQQSSVSNLAAAVSDGLIHCGTLVLLGMAGYFAIFGHPALTAGEVIKLLGWLGIMYGPVRHLAEVNITYQTSMVSLDRVFQVFAIAPRIVDKPRTVTRSPEWGEVEYHDVRFRYDDAGNSESSSRLSDPPEADGDRKASPGDGREKQWILEGMSFKAAAGQRVALVGLSGSGKSTTMALLPRLFDVSEGQILVDGVDIRDYRLKALRRSIGIVQQQTLVFSGTVRENICYGSGDIDDAAMIRAATAANAHEFICRLPGSYESRLGERGVNLSGGQLQRLSIARALLRNPRILILDEATSSLDAESEGIVQEALERVMKGRTCFIIAHRLSTVRNADSILVIDRGRIVESGRNDDLIERDGLYARLARQQFGNGLHNANGNPPGFNPLGHEPMAAVAVQ